MRSWSRIALITAALALPAQELYVRSEFQRVGADGKVIPQDRAERPREILSPAFARNGFASYMLTANIPAGIEYSLEIGQNPEDAVRVVMYRQIYGANGIPDKLEKVALPVAGKTTKEENLTFWVDFWVADNAPVRRMKPRA